MHTIKIVCRIYINFQAGSLLSLLFDTEDWDDLFPEMSIDFQRTTWRYIPEDSTLHKRLFDKIKEE
jgi:hypothetical protein